MTYEAWRISYQSSEQAARAAYEECMRLRAELTDLRNSMAFRTSLIGRIEAERDALRARIEAMEKQEPGAIAKWTTGGVAVHLVGDVRPGDILYLAPGAQPTPIAQDEAVRKAWARFSNKLHSSPDAPYPGMSESFEQHFAQSFTDREWRAESGTWAAAWKAAKRHEDNFAQPAPSVPEDVMRDAERYRYLRARDEGTAGVGCWLEADGRACDRGWLYGDQLDSAIDTCIEMYASAPEAKPCP